MSEFSHLWVGQQQALQSIVSVSLGIVSVGGFPAQNAELRVKQVFSPRKKKNSNNNLFFCSFFFFFLSDIYFVFLEEKDAFP